jgi:hypothetical protein
LDKVRQEAGGRRHPRRGKNETKIVAQTNFVVSDYPNLILFVGISNREQATGNRFSGKLVKVGFGNRIWY